MGDYKEMKRLFASMEDRFNRMETAIIAIHEEIDRLQTRFYKEVTLPKIELKPPELIPAVQEYHPNCQKEDSRL